MRFILSFLFLFVPWIFLSGFLDAFHLTLGVISASLIAAWMGIFFIPDIRKPVTQRFSEICKFVVYSFWLFREIIKSNLHVIYCALHPNLNKVLNPKMVTFKTTLKHELPKFVLANSITLTPGTVTVRVNDDEYLIHALTDKVSENLPGPMEEKVKSIFGRWS